MWRVRDRGRNDFYKEQCNFRKGERPKPQELDSLEAATVKGKPENNQIIWCHLRVNEGLKCLP